MDTEIHFQHIQIDAEIAGGKPHIRGRRITVQDIVVQHELLGKSVDQIAFEYDLEISAIYAALTFYHDHKKEIDLSIQATNRLVADLKNKIPSRLKSR